MIEWLNLLRPHRNNTVDAFPILLFKGEASFTDYRPSSAEYKNAVLSKVEPIIQEALEDFGNDVVFVSGNSQRNNIKGDNKVVIGISTDVRKGETEKLVFSFAVVGYIQKHSKANYRSLLGILQKIERGLGSSIEIPVRGINIVHHRVNARTHIPFDEFRVYLTSENSNGTGVDEGCVTAALGRSKREIFGKLKKVYTEFLINKMTDGTLRIYVFVETPPRKMQLLQREAIEKKLRLLFDIKEESPTALRVEYFDSSEIPFVQQVVSKMNNIAYDISRVVKDSKPGVLFIVVPYVPEEVSRWPQEEYKKLYRAFIQLQLEHKALQVITSKYFINRLNSKYDQSILEIGFKVYQMFGKDPPLRVIPKSFNPENTTYMMLLPLRGKRKGEAQQKMKQVKGYALYYRKDTQYWVRVIKTRVHREAEELVNEIVKIIDSITLNENFVIILSGRWKTELIEKLLELLKQTIHNRIKKIRVYYVGGMLAALPIINENDRVEGIPIAKIDHNRALVYPALFFATTNRGSARGGVFNPRYVELYYPRVTGESVQDSELDLLEMSSKEVAYLIYRHLAYRWLSGFGLHTPEPMKIQRQIRNKLGEQFLLDLPNDVCFPAYYFI